MEIMKIKWISVNSNEEVTITVTGHDNDPEMDQLRTLFSKSLGYVLAKKESRQFKISYHEIYYLESQDEHTILYTNNDSFVIPFRLYEVESWGDPFVRINKSNVVNLSHLSSFKPMLNSKLEAYLDNGDRLEVSRMYLSVIKEKLGVK
jgi:DNA-binding LytR/AlgR family response regulator